MTESVIGRIAALKTAPTPDLRAMWRDLFDSEPPRYNRRFLESRLAYRIQELEFGGLKPATVARLEALGEQLDGGSIVVPHPRRRPADRRHAAGAGIPRRRVLRDRAR